MSKINERVPVKSGDIGGHQIQTVNARDLHGFLEVGKDFSTWIKDRIDQYEFIENQDFVCSPILGSEGRGGHNRRDYHLTLDMAKEVAMVERNHKGKEARQYFIECERQAKAAAPAIPQSLPEALRLAAEAIEERDRLALENQAKADALAIAEPKAQALDRIASPTEGAVGLRIAAKLLQMPERQFLLFAHAEGYIFRNHHSRVWLKRPGICGGSNI